MHATWSLLSGLLLLGLVTTDNPWLHRLHDGIRFTTKRFSGIVGDAAHALRGGYHIGRIIQGLLNYSTSRPLDRLGDGLMSAGYDLGLGPAEMIAGTSRVINGMRSGDPRAAAVREVNGTLDGRTTVNYDITLHGQNYQPDLTHLWHMHFGFWRGLICDAAKADAVVEALLSLINGETLADYLRRIGTPAPVETVITEDEMPTLHSAGKAGGGEVYVESGGRGYVLAAGAEGQATFNALVAAGAKVSVPESMNDYLMGRAIACGIPWDAVGVSDRTKPYPVDLLQLAGVRAPS